MMNDPGLPRLTDSDVAAFYGAPFSTLTITQQALSDEFWEHRAAAGKAGCQGYGIPCRHTRITSTVLVRLMRLLGRIPA